MKGLFGLTGKAWRQEWVVALSGASIVRKQRARRKRGRGREVNLD